MQKYIKNDSKLLFTKEFLHDIETKAKKRSILDFLIYNEGISFRDAIEKIEQFLNKYDDVIEKENEHFNNVMKEFAEKHNLN